MTAVTAVTRLSVGDLMNFWAELPGSPLQVGLAGVVDDAPWVDELGRPGRAAVAAWLTRRLAGVPELRRRVRWTHLGQGRPVWQTLPEVDPDRLLEVAAPGRDLSLDSFYGWAAQASTAPLGRDAPLWRMVLVPRVLGSSVGVLLVAHHALLDGLGGAAVLGRLLAEDGPSGAVPGPGGPPLTGAVLARDNARLRTRAVADLARHPGSATRLLPALTESGRALREGTAVTTLSGAASPLRQADVLRLDLETARNAAHRQGVTLNDLVLAVTAAGLHAWLHARGELRPGLTVRASVPMAVPGRAANQARMVVVPLPVAEADRTARLDAVNRATRQLKSSDADVAHAELTDSPLFPAWALRLGVRWLVRHGGQQVSCFVTDVTGPAQPLTLAGGRLRQVAGFGPLAAGVRLGVTAFSCGGELAVAFVGDGTLPDWDRLVDAAAAELHRLAP